MLFNSIEFLLFFLPLVVLFFYLIIYLKKVSLLILYLAFCSLVFYSWWNPKYVLLIIFSILINYTFYKLIKKDSSYSKLYLNLGIIFNLSLLVLFKYLNFLKDIFTDITDYQFDIYAIILPLGISFFTFQQIAFLVDGYKKKIDEINFKKYFLFVSFFPQLIAGPIVNFFQVSKQFNNLGKNQKNMWENISIGTFFISLGLLKKTFIVEKLSSWSDKTFYLNQLDGKLTFLDSWVGLISFSLQIYFDFSAYSDIAIGLGMLFGIYLPFNFNSPYKALNIIDFWRNWHITLSNFLKNYLYIPLGGSKNGKIKKYKNLFIVMIIGGLWHGASWNFIFWGALHGVYLIVNHFLRSVFPVNHHQNLIKIIFKRLFLFFLVSIAWVFFRTNSFIDAINFYKSLFVFNGVILPKHYEQYLTFQNDFLNLIGVEFGITYAYEGFNQILCLLLLFIFVISSPNIQEVVESKNIKLKFFKNNSFISGLIIGILFLFIIIKIMAGNQGEFIYFQF